MSLSPRTGDRRSDLGYNSIVQFVIHLGHICYLLLTCYVQDLLQTEEDVMAFECQGQISWNFC